MTHCLTSPLLTVSQKINLLHNLHEVIFLKIYGIFSLCQMQHPYITLIIEV